MHIKNSKKFVQDKKNRRVGENFRKRLNALLSIDWLWNWRLGTHRLWNYFPLYVFEYNNSKKKKERRKKKKIIAHIVLYIIVGQ
jgi:hypothetical protein